MSGDVYGFHTQGRGNHGVWWVEIAAANLRILCGCPADAVKHLMKRG